VLTDSFIIPVILDTHGDDWTKKTFGFIKMREISSLAEEFLGSEEALYSMESVSYYLPRQEGRVFEFPCVLIMTVGAARLFTYLRTAYLFVV
jgi:hypothetical protein